MFTKSKLDTTLAIYNMSGTSLFTYITHAYNNNHKQSGIVWLFGYFHIVSGKLKLKSISFLLWFTLLCDDFYLPAVFRITGSAPGKEQEL